MPPKPSIFRGPDAQHFQLVHRSLRDPLINDPEASDRVLKPVERANDRQKPGYTLAELDATLDKSKIRDNEGEAALYGVTYDDSAYDYMAHLRPLAGGFDSVLIPGPKGSGVAKGMKTDRKGKGKELFVPEEVLASQDEVPLQDVYGRSENIPAELQGLQPDMDPHLRQVLEALDDDAFVDADDEEDDGKAFWGALVAGGEANEDERQEYEFEEWGVEETEDEPPGDETWQDRFKAFKQGGAIAGGSDDEVDDADQSEMDDTVGSLATNLGDMMVKGGKKRRGKRGPSDASGMSMSSSSMFRNQGLRDLDTRFDKVERDYDLEDDEDDEDDEDYLSDDASNAQSTTSTLSRASLFSSSSAVPEVSREDFDAILDDFLDNYEVVGKRLRPALGGNDLSGPEKLRVLRNAVEGQAGDKEDNTRRVMEVERNGGGDLPQIEERVILSYGKDEDKWDVETVLTTYTNTENHPSTIRSRTIPAAVFPPAPTLPASPADDDDTSSGSETERESSRVTVTRPKGESPAERKARKASVKAERSARRQEKKEHRATFEDQRRKNLVGRTKMAANGRAADVAVGSKGVVSLS